MNHSPNERLLGVRVALGGWPGTVIAAPTDTPDAVEVRLKGFPKIDGDVPRTLVPAAMLTIQAEQGTFQRVLPGGTRVSELRYMALTDHEFHLLLKSGITNPDFDAELERRERHALTSGEDGIEHVLPWNGRYTPKPFDDADRALLAKASVRRWPNCTCNLIGNPDPACPDHGVAS